jgi:hypothetical protein
MRRVLFVLVAVFVALRPFRADAITVRDVLELSRAGLGEETLLALIEVDPSVFPIDTATLKSLKDAGVSERVIVAMVRSARTYSVAAADTGPMPDAIPQAPEPQVVVIDHQDSAPQIREVPIAVPVYIPIVRRGRVHDGAREHGDRDGRDSSDRPRSRPAEPVYWGFGGKLRPDAWQPK